MNRKKKLILLLSIIVPAFLMISFLAYKNFAGRAASAALNDQIGENLLDNSDLSEDGNNNSQNDVIKYELSKTTIDEEDLDSIPGVTSEKGYGKKLVEDGSTNILILGEDKLNFLYDTVGIISIDQRNRKVKIIMIPRDTYVQYNKKVLKVLENAGKLNVPGVFKINYAHHIGPMMKYDGKFNPFTSINFLSDVIKEKFNVEINDYIKVNTDGFAEIVDLFGGVEINVPYEMDYYDPTQELTIDLPKGTQRLDGRQAEGFVRFRQGFREDGKFFEIGDDGRKENQIAFLRAFIKQHGTISNIDKIPRLFKALGRNVQHSVGVGDVMFKYMGLAKDIVLKKYEIESFTLKSSQDKWINGSKYMIIED